MKPESTDTELTSGGDAEWDAESKPAARHWCGIAAANFNTRSTSKHRLPTGSIAVAGPGQGGKELLAHNHTDRQAHRGRPISQILADDQPGSQQFMFKTTTQKLDH